MPFRRDEISASVRLNNDENRQGHTVLYTCLAAALSAKIDHLSRAHPGLPNGALPPDLTPQRAHGANRGQRSFFFGC